MKAQHSPRLNHYIIRNAKQLKTTHRWHCSLLRAVSENTVWIIDFRSLFLISAVLIMRYWCICLCEVICILYKAVVTTVRQFCSVAFKLWHFCELEIQKRLWYKNGYLVYPSYMDRTSVNEWKDIKTCVNLKKLHKKWVLECIC